MMIGTKYNTFSLKPKTKFGIYCKIILSIFQAVLKIFEILNLRFEN